MLVRTVPPSSPVVMLDDLKAHLRVDGNMDDVLITAFEAAAVAHLDGYRGILGRCILEQQWAETYAQAGTYRLPFPDISAISAVDADDAQVSASLTHDDLGSVLELAAPATVTMTAAIPEDALPAVVMAIKLLVGHWYENREAASDVSLSAVPLAFDAILAPIRAVRI